MKRKYPLGLFFLMLLLNFTVRHFYLFLPGVLLSIIGIWNKSCLAIGLAVLLVDLIVSLVDQLQIRKASLEESDNEEYNELMDAFLASDDPNAFGDLIARKAQKFQDAPEEAPSILEKLVVYRTLKSSIQEGMALAEMVDAFEQMCEISVGEPDDLLFETGTYRFTGEKLFYFSLVRQFQFLDENEYVQLRLDVTYPPCAKTRFLFGAKWASPTDGGFFDRVRTSRAYRVAQDLPIHQVSVRVEET